MPSEQVHVIELSQRGLRPTFCLKGFAWRSCNPIGFTTGTAAEKSSFMQNTCENFRYKWRHSSFNIRIPFNCNLTFCVSSLDWRLTLLVFHFMSTVPISTYIDTDRHKYAFQFIYMYMHFNNFTNFKSAKIRWGHER